MLLSPALYVLVAASQSQSDLARHVYPLARAVPSPEVIVDTKDFPEGHEWAEEAKRIVESWYPKICELLATDGRDPLTGQASGEPLKSPKTIKLVFKKTLSNPAYTQGGTITVNGEWITKHPDDLGMVVHELTHVIQHYPGQPRDTGWLVEGIADYVRWWRYEPELQSTKGRTKIDPTKAKYTDAYRTTAMWLAWSGRKYNMALVPCLDKCLRDGKDPLPEFKRVTGKSAEELWDLFVADQPKT